MTFPLFRRALGPRDCANAWRTLGAKIDATALIAPGAMMRLPENVTIGAGSRVGNVELDAWAPITIGANTIINEAHLLTGSHHLDAPDFAGVSEPLTIGDYVWIIRRVIVLPGVTVGNGAVLATGAVVTRDVDHHSVVAGNPAREIKKRPSVDFAYVPSAPGFGRASE